MSPIIQVLTSRGSIFAIGFSAAGVSAPGVCDVSEDFLPQETMITAMTARTTNSRDFFIEISPAVECVPGFESTLPAQSSHPEKASKIDSVRATP